MLSARLAVFSAVAILILTLTFGTAARASQRLVLRLPNGEVAQVDANGVAKVERAGGFLLQQLPLVPRFDGDALRSELPDPGHLIARLAAGPSMLFDTRAVIVIFRPGIIQYRDIVTFDAHALAASRRRTDGIYPPLAYTNDATANRVLATLGVTRSERLFRAISRPYLSNLRLAAQASTGESLLDFSSAYRLQVTAVSVPRAVTALVRAGIATYVAPDWKVEPTSIPSLALPSALSHPFRSGNGMNWLTRENALDNAPTLPNNYDLESSAQSLFNAPSVNAASAYDEIERTYRTLPGTGETITNVSLGDLDDPSAASNPNDPCYYYAKTFGPTTEVVSGQRYLDLPSMPLIPTFTSDDNGNLSGTGEVCGVDPYIGEIGLDFSMMSSLPHSMQRPGEQGSGLSDLLGIAPGAQYRLVVPASSPASISDVDGALLGAAMQVPSPNVITASIGFGEDEFGFPGRYLEDDRLTQSIIATIVNSSKIVVCVAGGDGTRRFTNVAIGDSGGSAPTQKAIPGQSPTSLDDIVFSTVPSVDTDSGSIDVGGSTLDDIFSAPPQDPAQAALAAQHAFAETRWNGAIEFSSAFGSRVDVSAPSDNVLALQHHFGGTYDSVDMVDTGGTSASAPEVAAASAVLLQVASLTGHPFPNPKALRSLLKQTGTAVPNVPQSDVTLQVGPQINLGHAVESLLAAANLAVHPRVSRIAVEQRRQLGDPGNFDGLFLTDTDATNIDLQDNRDETAWITISPDWEGLPTGVTYRLMVGNGTRDVLLARTAWARLQPAQILAAADLSLGSPMSRTVKLQYLAFRGFTKIAGTNFSLTFGPAPTKTAGALAPIVSSIITGNAVPVTYDLSGVANVANPKLVVSYPGRVTPFDFFYRPAYSVSLHSKSGIVQVPVSALQGGGIYGIGIEYATFGGPAFSDFAFTRVERHGSARPAAPLFSVNGSSPGHILEVPAQSALQVTWDASNVVGADGAELEFSAAGPTIFRNSNPFNNPNGSQIDHNGIDFGSVFVAPLGALRGTKTITLSSTVTPGFYHVVRVIATAAGVPIGEAGDVSTLIVDAISTTDGLPPDTFALNYFGGDGFLTTASSLDAFTTQNAPARLGLEGSGPYATFGGNVWSGDVSLFASSAGDNLLDPVSTVTVGSPWTPPSPSTLDIQDAGLNSTNDIGVFFAQDTSVPFQQGARYFGSLIKTDKISSIYDITGPVSSYAFPVFTGIAQDTSLDRVYFPAFDLLNGNAAPIIVVFQRGTNSLSSISEIGSFDMTGFAVDSTTNKGAGLPTCNDDTATSECLVVYDLKTSSATEYVVPGQFGFYPVADAQHGLIVFDQAWPPDALTNNNALSRIVVADESGNVRDVREQFNFFNTFLPFRRNALQLTSSKKAVTFGPATPTGQQLISTSY